MKRIRILSFIITILIAFTINTSANQFISGFEDIPLMSGLKQIENKDFSFGNEETRYIEVELVSTSNKSFDEVKKFYKKSLKQLGWEEYKNSHKSFSLSRENDILEIYQTSSHPLKINIILKNRN